MSFFFFRFVLLNKIFLVYYFPVKMVAMFNRFAALENRELQEHIKHHVKPLKLD